DTDQVVVVNITGLLIWRAVASEPRSQEQIAAALVEQCDNVPPEQVTQDVDEFLEKLLAKGIVGIYQGIVGRE
ncbi:MAG: PqqD family protein, partial [Thermoflexales bacterium]|nr:PqqD family protein [Thermoflexales bacterium]